MYWIFSAILLALTFLVVIYSQRRSGIHDLLNPITVFLVFMPLHAVLSYPTSFFSVVWTNRTLFTLQPYLDEAFIAISIGIASTLLGYLCCLGNVGVRMGIGLVTKFSSVQFSSVAKRSVLCLIASIGITAAFLLLYGVPVFDTNAGTSRYKNFLSLDNSMWPFFLNRAKELIVLSVALLAMGMREKILSKSYIFIIVVALTVVLLTAHRTPLMMLLFFGALYMLLRKRVKRVVLVLSLIGALYLVSVSFLLNDDLTWKPKEITIENVLLTTGAGLSELRDCAWVLSSGQDRWYGLTFVVGLLPVPAYFNEFTNTYRIRTLTLQAAGLSLDADAGGGFRLTFPGECYLNFGLLGVVPICFIYGFGCGVFRNVLRTANAVALNRRYVFEYVFLSVWLLYSFVFYLSGSGISGLIKGQIIFLCIILVSSSRWKKGRRVKLGNGQVYVFHPTASTLGR